PCAHSTKELSVRILLFLLCASPSYSLRLETCKLPDTSHGAPTGPPSPPFLVFAAATS
ncbi:hypothetical protein P7K49_031456, partial [Saguinus oedipus]